MAFNFNSMKFNEIKLNGIQFQFNDILNENSNEISDQWVFVLDRSVFILDHRVFVFGSSFSTHPKFNEINGIQFQLKFH